MLKLDVTEKELQIFILYYSLGTLRKVGQKLKLHPEIIRLIKNKVIFKINSYIYNFKNKKG